MQKIGLDGNNWFALVAPEGEQPQFAEEEEEKDGPTF